MYKIFINWILRNFFQITLTSVEREMAIESIRYKYALAFRNALVVSLLIIPAILLLDTEVIVSVLIPITMVAGTAWFAISLAHVKKKFESFGMELTKDLFESFTASLMTLMWLVIFALFKPFWIDKVTGVSETWILLAALLGSLAMLRVIYLIFVGALKYDINDSMLAGQSEAAEKYYKRALSVLHVCADNLQTDKTLQVANYYIGVSFWETFNYIKRLRVGEKLADKVEKGIAMTSQLITNPSMPQREADDISRTLIGEFLTYCTNVQGADMQKSYQAIEDELNCLKNNKKEDQAMVDTRLAVVFQEISHLLEGQGETLFK